MGTPVGIAIRNFSLMSGVGRYVAELARRLPVYGYDPHVFARRLPSGRTYAPWMRDISRTRVPWVPLTSWSRAASFDWWARRRMRSRKITFVHGHGDLTRQTVLSVHNCDEAAARYVPDGRRPSAGVRYIRQRQFEPGGCRVVVANSDMVRRDLAEFYGLPPERIRRVYLGVDTERFHPRDRARARTDLLLMAGWPAEMFLVLAVLSGDAAKRNFSLLTLAVENMSRQSMAGLCVVGNADWTRDPAACRLRERDLLLVMPPTPNVEMYFAGADVFALPAFYEEFGLTVLEALSSGCPAVVSSRCGASELIQNGSNGYVFNDLANPEELANCLERARALHEKGNTCRRTAELYTWDRHAEEMAKLYGDYL